MSNYYLGTSPENLLGDTPRYFYGLRKNENGSLFFIKNDNIADDETIEINNPGDQSDNFNDYEVGVDFYEGIDVYHRKVFQNLKYQQYRWDERSIMYYIDDEGNLVVKVNQGYDYPAGVSED